METKVKEIKEASEIISHHKNRSYCSHLKQNKHERREDSSSK